LAFLINRCTRGAVSLVFNHLKQQLGTCEFFSLFEHLLTNRNSKFGDLNTLKTRVEEIQRATIYYYSPMMSGQRGGV
jgi:hypothetical protein